MSEHLQIRPAQPSDVTTLIHLIRALADYERLTHLVTASEDNLTEHLFGDYPYAEAIVADWDGVTVGFALFFTNYSTFLTKPGLYLEDLFVLPDYRLKWPPKTGQ